MTAIRDNGVLALTRTIFGVGRLGGLDDAALLDRFALGDGPGAEAAFAALVARHGPMVLGVCRRFLRDPNDVDDAFQAAFLVLARKAGAVRVDGSGSAGRWLYGVSLRVARRARAVAERRKAREVSGSGVEPWVPGDRASEPDLRPALDEELGRLPSRDLLAVKFSWWWSPR